MITERSTAARSLRAVALVITLVSVVSFSALGYSAYSVASGLLGSLQQGSSSVTVKEVQNGSSATLYVNATVLNSGLFPLRLSASCNPAQSGITCSPASVTVSPGGSGQLRFQVRVDNTSSLQGGAVGLHVNSTIGAEIVPWASLNVTLDLSQFLNRGISG